MTNTRSAFILFCGNFPNQDALDSYLQIDYDECDDCHSAFMADFNITWYDEDFAEAGFYIDQNLSEHLKHHSFADGFDEQVYHDLAQHTQCNAFYIIYDYQEHFDDNSLIVNPNAKMTLVGSYSYHK